MYVNPMHTKGQKLKPEPAGRDSFCFEEMTRGGAFKSSFPTIHKVENIGMLYLFKC